jgi:hypothetical protein
MLPYDVSPIPASAPPSPCALEDDAHPLRDWDFSPTAWFVAAKLRGAGHECYFVGGTVRDALLKGTPKDVDVLTSAELHQVRGRLCERVGALWGCVSVLGLSGVVDMRGLLRPCLHPDSFIFVLISCIFAFFCILFLHFMDFGRVCLSPLNNVGEAPLSPLPYHRQPLPCMPRVPQRHGCGGL